MPTPASSTKHPHSPSKHYSTPPKSCYKSKKDPLTAQEKKANHIASEQKRRQAIREGFANIASLVPLLAVGSHSKSTILFEGM
jgi:hypothetical protein